MTRVNQALVWTDSGKVGLIDLIYIGRVLIPVERLGNLAQTITRLNCVAGCAGFRVCACFQMWVSFSGYPRYHQSKMLVSFPHNACVASTA
jgi:hypothetical protein